MENYFNILKNIAIASTFVTTFLFNKFSNENRIIKIKLGSLECDSSSQLNLKNNILVPAVIGATFPAIVITPLVFFMPAYSVNVESISEKVITTSTSSIDDERICIDGIEILKQLMQILIQRKS